jgi:acetoin utilization protein AcuB
MRTQEHAVRKPNHAHPEPTRSGLVARDVMTPDPMTLGEGKRVRDAVEILETLEIRHLPIVDEAGSMVGIVSDRDIRSASIQHVLGGRLASLGAILDAPIATIMSGDVVTVGLAAELDEVIDLLLEHRLGAIPVVDEDEELVGILSYVDVLRALRPA